MMTSAAVHLSRRSDPRGPGEESRASIVTGTAGKIQGQGDLRREVIAFTWKQLRQEAMNRTAAEVWDQKVTLGSRSVRLRK